jgi:hypothetical protein
MRWDRRTYVSCFARRMSGSRGSRGSGSYRHSFRIFGRSIRMRFMVRHPFRSGARASRSYQWPATHRQRRIHTSQPRSSRPMIRGDPTGVAGCVHDQPWPNSAQIMTSLNRSNASCSASATASGTAILITPTRVYGGSRSSARGPHATPGTPAIGISWCEGPSAGSSLASAGAPASVASRTSGAFRPARSPPGAGPARRLLCLAEAIGGDAAELVPGADVKLQKDLVQVVLDGSGTDEQPRADFGVG